jgi:hypothetical protein
MRGRVPRLLARDLAMPWRRGHTQGAGAVAKVVRLGFHQNTTTTLTLTDVLQISFMPSIVLVRHSGWTLYLLFCST